MVFKRSYLQIFPIAIVAVALLAACGTDEAPAEPEPQAAEEADAGYADGVYFAQQDDFSDRTGWKYTVTLTVSGGEITDVEWNAAHRDAGRDKVTLDRDGDYGMKDNSDAQWHWWEQAQATEQHLLETQDPSPVDSDAISGATINVGGFFELAQAALDRGPTGYGPWQDGAYSAQADEYSSSGWKDVVDITVIGGRIVAVNWDPLAEDGGTNKKQRSMDGEYGMKENSGAQWPWWEQAVAAERHLMDSQTTDNLNTDAVSGASISLGGFEALVATALSGASR